MAEKKQDTGFTVTDRRLFTTDGELAFRRAPKKNLPQKPRPAAAPRHLRPQSAAPGTGRFEMPPPPSAAEQKAMSTLTGSPPKTSMRGSN